MSNKDIIKYFYEVVVSETCLMSFINTSQRTVCKELEKKYILLEQQE